ncbi:hypothetical protein EP30_02475 [Bifidobacterium sp. UTCIF-39]|uniref:hypothetical protein n=1 Tax=Bifidobacterium sp. UTCIF-39 TaxID=1465359 RepID=UPI00112D239C|nr:hypothetical protein [Bifidobacterium sp. UTCIF-39]TPF97475.1 hypothetical protein EP30_02475 [Bifidobacterium sp. UTCIF-39]
MMKLLIRGAEICGVIIVLSMAVYGITHPEILHAMIGPIYVTNLVATLGGLLIAVPITGEQIRNKSIRGDAHSAAWKTIPWACIVVEAVLWLFVPNTMITAIANAAIAIIWGYLLFCAPKQ